MSRPGDAAEEAIAGAPGRGFGGMLADFTAPDLGVIAVRAALGRGDIR